MHASIAKRVVGVVGVAILGLVMTESVQADPPPKLRFGFQADQKLAYEMKIVARFVDTEETREGLLIYTVTSSADDQFAVKCDGNLKINTKCTGGGRSVFPMPPHFPRPFGGGPNMVQRPMEWTLGRQGNVIVVGRVNQIPWALGPEELLVFESLPAESQATWNTVDGVGVREKSSGRAGGVGPVRFYETDHGAMERVDYSILESDAERVRLSKKYELKTSPIAAEGGMQLTMTGTGELVFDIARGAFKLSAMKYDIEINEKNVKVTVPITLSYRLLTDQELVAYQEKEKERIEAEKKAKEPKPIDALEMTTLLDNLKSEDAPLLNTTLERFALAVVDDHPEKVSAKILPFLQHTDHGVKVNAAKALAVWATPDCRDVLMELIQSDNLWLRNAAIVALGRVPSTAAAEAVASKMSEAMSRGDCGKSLRAMGPVAEKATIPLLKNQDFWVRMEACKVLKEIGGRAAIKELQALIKDGSKDRDLKETLDAVKFRVALKGDHSADASETTASETTASKTAASKTKGKDKEKDAAEEKTDGESKGEMRSWRDASGSFEITASFVQLADNKVTLRKKDGKTIVVPLEKLSKLDQTWVEENGSAASHANPFE